MRVLFVDPGLATGVAEWSDDDPTELWVAYEAGGSQKALLEWLVQVDVLLSEGMWDVVGCESFNVTVETAKKSPQPWSLELIGALRYLCHHHDVPFRLQQPVERKWADSDKLKKLDLWKLTATKDGHAREAMRHLVTYLCNERLIDPRRVLLA